MDECVRCKRTIAINNMGCDHYHDGKPVRYCATDEAGCNAILSDLREQQKEAIRQAANQRDAAVAVKVREQMDVLGIATVDEIEWSPCSYQVMRDGMRVFHDTSRTLRMRKSMYDFGNGAPGEAPCVCECGCPVGYD